MLLPLSPPQGTLMVIVWGIQTVSNQRKFSGLGDWLGGQVAFEFIVPSEKDRTVRRGRVGQHCRWKGSWRSLMGPWGQKEVTIVGLQASGLGMVTWLNFVGWKEDRALILWEHLKDLHQPESAHLHNSCYVRKRKPLFTYLTVCELRLHSEGHGPNGYDPFPLLRLLTEKVREACGAAVHGVAESDVTEQLNSNREGQSKQMKSIHRRRSQEIKNKARSSSLSRPEFLCSLVLC